MLFLLETLFRPVYTGDFCRGISMKIAPGLHSRFWSCNYSTEKKLNRVAATKIACVNEPIECHYDPIFDIHFFHFRTQRSSLNILPNFNLLRSIERRCFGTLFLWIYGRINFPCSNSWLKIGVNDVIFSKLRSDWNYNNDKCEKLHEYRGQRFCSSLCELLYWLLL